MSSFLVYYSKQNKLSIPKFFNDFSKIEINDFSILYKDNPNTLFYNFDKRIKYIVSGLGIGVKNNPTFITNADWEQLVSNSENIFDKINGHFAGCIVNKNKLICFNDILGLRDIYYYKDEDQVIISSRYDYFNKFLINLNLAEDYVAGMWLTSIPPFYKTPFKEINRLGPGGRVEFSKFEEPVVTNYKLNFESADQNEVYNSLKSFTLLDHPSKIFSLGLSGGLDSRTLLSIMLSKNSKINAHTFGSKELADVQIAKRIAVQESFQLTNYNDFSPSVDEVLYLVKSHLPFSGLTIPISDLIHIHYHKQLDLKGSGIIDGGFGEIGRRQFMNRFLLGGRKIVSQKNTDSLLANLTINRGEFFNADFAHEMKESLYVSSERLWSEMSEVSQDDIQFWLDAFAVKYKLANVYSYGQHTLDQIAVAYMPFAQPDFLKLILQLPTRKKINGKIYRNIISQKKPDLKKINLVKDYVEYPFCFGTISSHMVRKFKRKYSQVESIDSIKYKLYDELKEYLGDEINSTAVRESSFYNMGKIEKLFDEYYSGNKSKLAELDWWSTYNEWLKIMFVKDVT